DSDVSQDADNDGLNNLDEYTNNTDPRDRDSDDDYMLDGWEVNNNLDPLDDSDSNQDLDNDDLTNLEEYYIGLDPNDVDTDNDGLNDGMEYENGINPNNSDTDDDGLPDIWEYNNGLNPLDDSDADADSDGDGLTNTEEYDAGTDPKNADSDADGMPDGWEDTYGLDPNDPNDAEGDKDQDDYSNIVEFIHGSDPNDANSLSEPNTIIVPTDVNSIQSAIDVSIAGDVIEVLQGTYYESINFNSETITLTSTDPNIWWIVEGTIIDANAPNVPVVIFDSNDVNSVLTGFTVKGGSNGISCSSSSSPTITKCIIEDNNSHGIYCTSGSPWIVNNMIRLNNGNGIYSSSSTPPPIKNNWIYSNSNGIGFSSAASAAIVRNNTIIYNDSNGIHVDSNTAPTISNCILWNNGDDLVNCTATYSCIEDSNDAGDPNMHNICDDPCFANIFEFLDETTSDGNTTTIIVADANLYDVNDVIEYNNDGTVRTVTDVNTATGTITFANDPLDVNSVAGILIHNWGPDANDLDADFHISANSACINTGDPNADPNYAGEFDIDGQVRVRGENVDMGADEGAVTWYVDIDANGADTGFSWEDAFISIQDAIDTALDGDTIIIAEGTYYESISYSGKTMTVKSTDPEDSDVIAATIIDANDPNDPNDANTPVVIFDSGGSTGSVLSGLTITGGNTGVCCSMLSSPVITNCVIRDNNGLGVRCASSSPIVKNCIITGNSGSGISGGSPTITNCTIVYNGGNGLRDCGGQIRNCIFWGNGYDELYYSSATYSCVEDSNSGEGNINYMPYFTNVGGSDYHLLSYSPCIDTGDPNSDYSNEPNNGGDRINMGAYGNTPEAALASADSDDDNLPDTWELLYWPSIDSNDANDDPDTDNLTNLQEYHIGLDPNDSDTDDDGLWDGWELDNGLNPNNSDTDGDGIPDGWEYNNGLDPLDDSDAEADSDGDGLTNIEEYSIGTSPKNTDSDTDGMPDGWEDSHGFNPMDPNDADGDLDQDGHSNVVEFIHGSDPNDANSLSEPNTITVPTDVNSIQFAIDVSIDGDVIEVLQGTYYESIDFGAKAVTLTGTNPNDWWVVESTVIDGNNANNVVVFDSGEEANSVLTGLMITNGQYGISCSNSSSPTITRCVIEDNNSHGIYCTSGSPEITNNMIGLNEEGDGIYSSSLTPPTIKNNFIYGNSNGIGFSSATSAAIVRNNSIVDNDSNGIHVDSNTAPTISNCILWNNGDDLDNCSATYSCIKNNDAGTGNINGDSNDPLFIDAGGYDYRLQRTSPCINAGDPNADPNYSDETDIEGQVREAKTVDMGADEVCEVHNTTKGEKGTWYSAVDGEGIQDAIDDANNGDVIVVYEWTFNESIHINDVNVTLTSTDPNDWDVVEC
ncbi:MAG: hypothetical protein GWN14_01250, partial [candidate division Zixibacteria bacterium]|nr:right-handed parallel beta-helix repeat-containing protein [candidate division Zixibacteria bacterium]NIW43479.1 hypothetical protein [Gammaproteobacteria bacterium]NIX54585.1 hypothetical protein [candidate division Zixibacteria bacterium]